MPASPARAAAFDILLRVENEAGHASDLLHAARYSKLSSPDHSLATEIVMGVLRWRYWLDHWIAQSSSQKLQKLDIEVLTALRMGLYQLWYLERVPARAAIHESVELVKRARKNSAVPFTNAVLRKLTALARPSADFEQRICSAESLEPLSQIAAHPLWLVERWVAAFGLEATKLICIYDQSVPPTTIRLRDSAAENGLLQEGIELAPGNLLASARRVRSGDVTRTRVFAEGRIAIQDEASQLVALLVGKGSQLMDCCAAPGGKTSILADRNPQSRIVAAELNPRRARLLRERVSAKNVHVLAVDARALSTAAAFDRVLADVPCSGTGTLAHHPEIKWRLRVEDFRDLQSRQVQILRAAASQLATGGKLVYSTCSLEKEENSDVVERTLGSDKSLRLLGCRSELEALRDEGELVMRDVDSILSEKFLRILPGRYATDGFFAAVLQKER